MHGSPLDDVTSMVRGDDDHPVREAWALLEALVRIPSPTGDTDEAAAYLVDWARSRGLYAGWTPTGAPWLSTTEDPFAADVERPHLVFFGHLDTVPGDVPVRIDETAQGADLAYPEAAGPMLWGRGSVDAKGPLAVACAVLADLSARGTFPGTWTVVGAVDEEGDSTTAHWAKDAFATPPEGVVVGEPSGSGAVTLGYKGRIGLRAVFEAEVAHGGAPVPSAADRLVVWLAALEARLAAVAPGGAAKDAGQFERITHKVLDLATTTDGLVQRAEALVDIRLPPGVDPESVVTHLASAEGADAAADQDTPTLVVEESVAGHMANKRSRLVAAFNGALRAHGAQPRHLRKTGTADLCILAPVWDRTSFCVYGPGASMLDHTPEERVAHDEVARAVRVLADAFAVWSSSAQASR